MTEISPHWLRTPSGKVRARGLGLKLPGTPGPYNAITDVAGVAVGYSTIIAGEGPLVVGKGPVRTGVTAILPRGADPTPCHAGTYALNGNGEMTGTIWIEECGELQSPVMVTNTHSCGLVRDATIEWMNSNYLGAVQDWGLPVSAETYDGELNDINGFHVTREHVFEALNGAAPGPLELGSKGGGTGMICFDFKGGNGSASRLAGGHTIGVFAQANFGLRHELTILGKAVGREIDNDLLRGRPAGSIIAVVATDAPLQPHQLKRLARRVPLGLARLGCIGHNSSGDIFLAFSTANAEALSGRSQQMQIMRNGDMDPLFEAVAEATEEAVIDAMVANETMIGRDGNRSIALPHDRLMSIMTR